MKTPILFLFRIIVVILFYTVACPFIFIIVLLSIIWDFNYKYHLKEFSNIFLCKNDTNWFQETTYTEREIYYYKNPWQFILNKKKYKHSKPNYDR